MCLRAPLPMLALLALLALAGCGDRPSLSLVRIDGSSTVYPVLEAVAEEFQRAGRGQVRVTVGVSGTGGGFKKFCRGETDLSNASRPISAGEIAACRDAGIEFIELPIAFDAIAVVVHPGNTWARTLRVDQLRAIWEPSAQGRVTRWNQVDPAWPDAPLHLFGAGSDSGTFDYFTEAVMGRARASRGDYTASEDDNVLVTGVAQDRHALGYFGMAYLAGNADRVQAARIATADAPAGVAPTPDTVIDGRYQPLSRPVFVYVNAAAARDRPEVRALVDYLLREGRPLIEEVHYVPLPEAAYALARARMQAGRTGTVFAGHAEIGVSVEELLAREPR